MILIRTKSFLLLDSFAAKSKNTLLPSSSSCQWLTPRYRFTSGDVDPSPKSLFIVKYLIESVGLSSLEATKASKLIAHIKSRSQPDSVLKFFRNNGFTDTDIKRIVLINSRLLCANVDSTLKPKFEVLRQLGFSETQITKVVKTNPLCVKRLNYGNLHPRVEFFRGFIHSNDDLITAFSADTSLLSYSLEKVIKPNISFLRECKASNEKIYYLMITKPTIVCRNPDVLKSTANRVVELGFPCGSKKFFHALHYLCKMSREYVDVKLKFLTSLGFSGTEISSAILKQPSLLCLSMKNLSETVDFFVKEVGCDPSYLSNSPILVCYSLTKRLIPRNYVLQLLKEKGLLKKGLGFHYIFSVSEKKFLSDFILCFKEKMPELHDVYLSASAGKFLK